MRGSATGRNSACAAGFGLRPSFTKVPPMLTFPVMSRRSGFTLLEICIALFIAMLMLTLAVPGVLAMLAEQRLKASFDTFDGWVRQARERSITERRTYAMVWSEEGIELRAVERRDTDAEDAEPERFLFTEGETFQLGRPSALMKEPPGEWVFWRSGLCEEAVITFAGASGSWTVHYDPLTARGTFVDSEVK